MFYFIIFICARDGTHSSLVPGACSTTDEMTTQRVQSVLAAGTLAKIPVSVHFCLIGLQVIFNFFSINVPGSVTIILILKHLTLKPLERHDCLLIS